MRDIRRRLKRAEKQSCISEKPPVVFEYIDENGVEQRVEMLSDDFDRLLQEINGASKGLPIMEEVRETARKR
jgi:hypothetical protein